MLWEITEQLVSKSPATLMWNMISTIKHTLQKCPKVDVNAKPTPCMQLVHLYILNAYPWITAVETNLCTQGGDIGTFKCLLYFHLGCSLQIRQQFKGIIWIFCHGMDKKKKRILQFWQNFTDKKWIVYCLVLWYVQYEERPHRSHFPSNFLLVNMANPHDLTRTI